MEIARRAQRDWNSNGNVGLVVGATHPGVLPAVRELCPELPLLVPGVGAQGGDLALAARNAVDRHGERAIINASRGIMYPTPGDEAGLDWDEDFAEVARRAALRLRAAIGAALTEDENVKHKT